MVCSFGSHILHHGPSLVIWQYCICSMWWPVHLENLHVLAVLPTWQLISDQWPHSSVTSCRQVLITHCSHKLRGKFVGTVFSKSSYGKEEDLSFQLGIVYRYTSDDTFPTHYYIIFIKCIVWDLRALNQLWCMPVIRWIWALISLSFLLYVLKRTYLFSVPATCTDIVHRGSALLSHDTTRG